jgi:pSer/pThr/pTyr-binding forkhead associated (FHA) protein
MTNDPSMVAFLEACGSKDGLAVEVSRSGEQQAVPRLLLQPFAVLGREPATDLQFDFNNVSPRHAVLQRIASQTFCFDLASRAGTHWPDGPRSSGWVVPDVPIRIGPYWIGVHAASHDWHAAPAWAWNPLRPESQLQVPFVAATLEFMNGKARQRSWRLDRVLTLVGSAAACKVRFYSPSVAQFHCYLVATPDGVWVVDLLSAAGTLRNGNPVRFARLEDGDQLLIGGFLVRSRIGEPTATVAHPGYNNPSTPNPLHPVRRAEEGSGPETKSLGLMAVSRPRHLPALAAAPDLAVNRSGQVQGTQSPDLGMLQLMNHFSLMQQEMFDQFQQTMMMMFQMFGTLQKEQVGALRDELQRVQQLTRELQSLQETLDRSVQAQSAPQRPAVPAPCAPATGAPSAPLPVDPAKTSQRLADPPALSHPPTQVPKAPNGTEVPSAFATAAPASPASDRKAAHPGSTPEDLHAWLNQRMASIHEERQSRWQKILGMLGGKTP